MAQRRRLLIYSRSSRSIPHSSPPPPSSTYTHTDLHSCFFHALIRVCNTVVVAFEGSSYWRALWLLDLWAWLAVWRDHEHQHAAAVNTATVEAAAPGALSEGGASVSPELLADAALAAAHSLAAYGEVARRGDVDSWHRLLRSLTVGQLRRDAWHRILPATHLAAVQQMTGLAQDDVVASSWQARGGGGSSAQAFTPRRAPPCNTSACLGTLPSSAPPHAEHHAPSGLVRGGGPRLMLRGCGHPGHPAVAGLRDGAGRGA